MSLHGNVNTTPAVFKPEHQYHILDWANCWSFGNGLESDRIRDDFNAPQLDNGVKASTVTADPQIKEERRKHGIIWSGIYNTVNGTNNTNQFLIAENITKELNPIHGSIQALSTRDQSLIMFCEDKVLRAVTNKDALYNADGNPQLVASNAVVGDVRAYQGNFGISKNPESLVSTPYRTFFTDVVRGEVLSLSTEGVRSISNLGMRDYFADEFKLDIKNIIGTYDIRKREYNVTTFKNTYPNQIVPTKTTVSFSEFVNGWSSFKSFAPDHGVSINNDYYTFKNGHIYKHHDETSISRYASPNTSTSVTINQVDDITTGMVVTGVGIADGTIVSSISGSTVNLSKSVEDVFHAQDITFATPRNNFYGTQYNSDVTILVNDNPSAVKSFKAIDYEGSHPKVSAWTSESAQLLNNNYTSTTDGASDGLNAASNLTDEEYYNLSDKQGWYIDSIETNLQSCGNIEFINKEDKWFAFPTGVTTSLGNVDEKEFSVQGIGLASGITHENTGFTLPLTITVANNISTTYAGNIGGTTPWDSTPD